jgi:hypothetical protein
MRALTRICITTVVLVAMLGAPGPALADESDNFTCRARLTRDSLDALDALMNARIQEALDRANRRGAAACDANCLLVELQKQSAPARSISERSCRMPGSRSGSPACPASTAVT